MRWGNCFNNMGKVLQQQCICVDFQCVFKMCCRSYLFMTHQLKLICQHHFFRVYKALERTMKKNIESLCLQTSPLAQFNGQRACVVGFRSDRVEVEIEVGQSYVMVGNSCLCDHFGDRDGAVMWIFLKMMVSPKE